VTEGRLSTRRWPTAVTPVVTPTSTAAYRPSSTRHSTRHNDRYRPHRLRRPESRNVGGSASGSGYAPTSSEEAATRPRGPGCLAHRGRRPGTTNGPLHAAEELPLMPGDAAAPCPPPPTSEDREYTTVRQRAPTSDVRHRQNGRRASTPENRAVNHGVDRHRRSRGYMIVCQWPCQ
jgi:hypothetical protein